MSHFIIVGAGECGARAAFALRQKGFEGKITLIGTEELAPYERPPLSKDWQAGELLPKLVADAERYAEETIDLLLGVSVDHLDPAVKTVVLSDGRSLSYDKLLLTTGATARPFPGAQHPHGHIRTLRTHKDAVSLQKMLGPGRHVAVIGGGFIGLELAATARKLGTDVTLVEGLPRVLKRGVPEEIAEVISERHKAEGVDLRCNAAIASIEDRVDGASIHLASGDVIAADLVVVGIGSMPNTQLAEKAGLTVENGIAVDAHLHTSVEDIYAAGDCCSFPLEIYGGRRIRLESWRNAQEQGVLAATNMLGERERHAFVPWFWSDQYDLTLQIAGLADGAATTLRRDVGDGAFLLFHLDADGRLIAASGIGPGNSIARDIRLAEMLIAGGAHPDPQALSAPDVKLKSLLAA